MPVAYFSAKELRLDILFLLIPLSVVLAAAIGVVLFWAVNSGQFETSEEDGAQVIADDDSVQKLGKA